MQYSIANVCLKFSIDGHSDPQLVLKLLLQMYVRELHDFIVSPPDEGGLKEAIDVEKNIIISYSTLQ